LGLFEAVSIKNEGLSLNFIVKLLMNPDQILSIFTYTGREDKVTLLDVLVESRNVLVVIGRSAHEHFEENCANAVDISWFS